MSQHLRLIPGTGDQPHAAAGIGFVAPRQAAPRRDTEELDAALAAVVRLIRRQVAAQLTDAAREAGDETRLADGERARLVDLFVRDAMDRYAAEEISAGRRPLDPGAESRVVRAVRDELLGAGGLQQWLDNKAVEEITANGADTVHVRFADGSIERVGPIADSDEDLVELIRLMAARGGAEERRWDRAAPLLNLQLPDGSRLNAVMAVSKRPSVTVRRHRYQRVSLDKLVELGTLDACLRSLLRSAVRAKLNIIIAGEVGAGKTTLLRGLASAIPAVERLVTIEDTYELGFDTDTAAHPNVVPMQQREANVEGEGHVSMAMLFRNALRMGPDRVIVGEVRGDETVAMLNAMSQGNNGSLSTIHASSSAGVFAKLALYAAQAPERLDRSTTFMHIAEGVHLVVHVARFADGTRAVTSVREVVGADASQVASNEILRPGPTGRAVLGAPASRNLLDKLTRHGFDPGLLERNDAGWPR